MSASKSVIKVKRTREINSKLQELGTALFDSASDGERGGRLSRRREFLLKPVGSEHRNRLFSLFDLSQWAAKGSKVFGA
jgi:hypothetical protein